MKDMAPKKSLRPKMRPKDVSPKAEKGDQDLMKMEKKSKVKKMAMGGKCRGMGKATRGGNYKMG